MKVRRDPRSPKSSLTLIRMLFFLAVLVVVCARPAAAQAPSDPPLSPSPTQSGAPSPFIPPDCVVYYEFNDNYADSCSGNDLAAVNPQGFVQRPGGGLAATFSASAAGYLVSQPLTSLPAGNSARSITFWMQVASEGSGSIPVGWGWPTENGYYGDRAASVVWISSTSFMSPTSVAFATYNNDYIAQFPLGANASAWHFYCFTFDGAVVVAYLDGAVVGVGGLPQPADTYSDTPLYVGYHPWCCWGSSVAQYLDGALDEVGVFARALTGAEVGLMYAATGGGAQPPSSSGSSSASGSPTGTVSPTKPTRVKSL